MPRDIVARLRPQAETGPEDGQFPLARVVGADQLVPLVQDGCARYANLDYAASAPAQAAVSPATVSG